MEKLDQCYTESIPDTSAVKHARGGADYSSGSQKRKKKEEKISRSIENTKSLETYFSSSSTADADTRLSIDTPDKSDELCAPSEDLVDADNGDEINVCVNECPEGEVNEVNECVDDLLYDYESRIRTDKTYRSKYQQRISH